MEPDIQTEKYMVSKAMQKYGGSFVQSLGKALENADMENTQKIFETFREYWNDYLKVFKYYKMTEENGEE